jgi:acyl dehydratase
MEAIFLGQTISRERTLTQADFDLFARLSGDDNPIHVDPDFAARTLFGATVAHGVLLCAILRQLASEMRPLTVQKGQFVTYPAPTYAGENLRFFLEVTAMEGDAITLSGGCERVSDGKPTCLFKTVLIPREGRGR